MFGFCSGIFRVKSTPPLSPHYLLSTLPLFLTFDKRSDKVCVMKNRLIALNRRLVEIKFYFRRIMVQYTICSVFVRC